MKNKSILPKALFALLLILQVVLVYIYAVKGTYAYECVRNATYVYENGHFIISAPYMSIIGFAARVIRVHPLIIVNRVLPIILIPLSYGAYYKLLKNVFEDSADNRFIGLCVISILNLFGFQAGPSMPVMLLTGYFTGAGIVIHVILPLATGVLVNRSRIETKKRAEISETETADANENDDDYQEEWDMKKHRIVNARNLAIALGVLSIALIAFVYILNNKINTLYEATVNLQSEMNSNCKTYEFRPDGVIEGYLIKNSDGTITFIGGGNADNMDSLYNFITTYGDKVDSWYLYGDDEENSGAYEKCTGFKKLPVENVYIINRSGFEE